MVMEGGYPREMFVESITEDLVCKLCDGVLRSARKTPCGHVYCKACLESWVAEHRTCPRRCAEMAVKNLAWAGHVDTVVSGLTARCKNVGSGCKVQLPLREKATHEARCQHGKRSNARVPSLENLGKETVDVDWEDEGGAEEKESFFQRATKIVLSFRSRNARKKSSSDAKVPSSAPSKSTEEQLPATGSSMLTQRTFRLKRNRPKEPLGLVLLSGDKTSDGRHKSYYVKKVNRDTLGYRAGILAGDRIIKVDNHDLCRLSPQESVARIKEKSVLTLTVLREMGSNKHHKSDIPPHIYDEIDLFYSDQGNQLSQHALSQPLPGLSFQGPDIPSAVLSQFDENHPPTPPPMDFGKYSPSAQQKLQLQRNLDVQSGQRLQRNLRSVSPAAHVAHRTPPSYGMGERTSKDSGLSSGSSDSPNSAGKQLEARPPPTSARLPSSGLGQVPTLDLNRDVNVRKSYRTEQEMVRKFIKDRRRNSPAPQSLVASNQPTQSRNCRIAGDYELEDIHLEKNGTSQLGITLGYDSSAPHGSCLYVCEIVAGGLAAEDRRLRTGDIIQKVNGFRVFDPEEAILLFLEQDQDITLSVARKIKAPSKLRPQAEPDLDYLESKLLREGLAIRKVDSCGSLDSHTHHSYATLEPPPTLEPPSETGSGGQPPVVTRDKRSRSRDLQLMATSHDSVSESTTTAVRMRLMAMSRDSFDDFSSVSRARDREEDPYHFRRGSTPSQSNPLGGSWPITGSSPNLLRVQHSPPALHHQVASGSNLLGPHNRQQRLLHDRPSSTSPDSKFWSPASGSSRPIWGMVCQRKLSSPNLLEAREPRIMTPLSPTQPLASFHGIAKEIRRLPNRFDGHLDVCAAGGVEGRRESLV